METRLDILDFDAYDHMQAITLYPAELDAFFERGGSLGWGIVPTLDRDAAATEIIPSLLARFDAGVARLVEKGFDRELLLRRALITPSCGAGGGAHRTAGRAGAEVAARVFRPPARAVWPDG